MLWRANQQRPSKQADPLPFVQKAFETIARIRRAAPELTLAAGGGVRNPADIERLAACGCDAALVATALQDGRIGAAEVAAARHPSSTR